jgi:hypothetical protein
MNDTSANSDTSEFPLHCSSPLKSAPIKKLDNKLRSVCLNIQSIKSKREAPWNLLDSSNPDILFGCETWLNPNITDNEILSENTGYNIFRKDRKDRYGGVMLAIKSEIVSEPVDIDTSCEFIARKINRNTHDSLIVATIYRPTNNDVDYAKALYNTIKSLCLKYPKSTIWDAGDCNLPDIDWLTNTFSGNRYLNEINQTLLQIEEELGLSQTVKFPTRDKSTLELFFANRPSLLNRCEPIPGISDHDTAVYIDSDISIKRQRPTQRKIMLWNKTDLDGLKKEVTSFSDTFLTAHANTTNINSLWNDFKSGCLDIMNRYIPTKLTSTRYSQPWINREIKQLTRRKNKLFKKHQNNKSSPQWKKYKDLKKIIQRKCRQAYDNHINSMFGEDEATPNYKKFFNFIKSTKCERTNVAPLKREGFLHDDATTKANILNQQFASVFTEEDMDNLPDLGISPTPEMNKITINTEGAQNLLQHLKSNKATGPDDIPAKFLKEVSI